MVPSSPGLPGAHTSHPLKELGLRLPVPTKAPKYNCLAPWGLREAKDFSEYEDLPPNFLF